MKIVRLSLIYSEQGEPGIGGQKGDATGLEALSASAGEFSPPIVSARRGMRRSFSRETQGLRDDHPQGPVRADARSGRGP